MNLRNLLRPSVYAFKIRQALGRLAPHETATYADDGMDLSGKKLGFLTDPKFRRAYDAGMNAHFGLRQGYTGEREARIEFRTHVMPHGRMARSIPTFTK